MLARQRMRAAVPALIVGAMVALGASPLTAPCRASGAAVPPAVHHAGAVALVLILVGGILGLWYVLADRRVQLSAAATQIAAKSLRAMILVVVIGTVLGSFAAVSHPIGVVEARWQSFKHLPTHETASTHLTSIGSNRYDYYRSTHCRSTPLVEAKLTPPPENIPPLEQAVKKQPQNSEVHYLLGLAYLRAGRKAAARHQLAVALTLSPYDPAIKRAYLRSR